MLADTRPSFLLIAGSCLGAWCWRDVIRELEKEGHSARALDLPAQGDDETPYSQVTLDSYRDAILDDIARGDTSPVILVGHSAAGFPITAAAKMAPEKIAHLVYVCAYVPRTAQSLVDMRRAAPEQPVLDYIEKTPDNLAYSFKPSKVEAAMFHDCPRDTLDYAIARLKPQPIAPQATPLSFGANAVDVPKSYIRCMDDRTIPPAQQKAMIADWADQNCLPLPCGHAPFFAAPRALAEALIKSSR